ncbi:MAG: SPFH domain-containing protein [bacterium]|nr:SPFH domain-containing protein [bacterium]
MTSLIVLSVLIILVAILFFISGLVLSWAYEPPLDPPTAIVKRRFGKIVWVKIAREWIFVIPNIESLETLPIQRSSLKVSPAEVRTPDNVALAMEVTLYLIPDSDNSDNLMNYVKSGKEEGVKKILNDITEQEIRQWASDPGQTPKTWEEARSSQDDLTKRLHDKLIKECDGKPDDGSNKLPSYGMILEKVTIGPIKPIGLAVIEAAELEAKEKLERRGELAETATELEIAKTVSVELNISREKAFKLMKEYKMISAGHGQVLKVDFANIPEILSFGKRLLAGIAGGA